MVKDQNYLFNKVIILKNLVDWLKKKRRSAILVQNRCIMKDIRIHAKVSPNTRKRIKALAKRRKLSISSMANELLEKALENEEELWLVNLVEESEKESKGKPRISLEDVWRKLDIE